LKALATVWLRAFSLVSCVALNTVQVANHNYVMAFFTGGLLSFVWWSNSKTAAHHTGEYAQHAYAFGAACGTLNGMSLGIWLNG
jgi:hypothetical protein